MKKSKIKKMKRVELPIGSIAFNADGRPIGVVGDNVMYIKGCVSVPFIQVYSERRGKK